MLLRALFLAGPGVVSAGIVRGWQMAGHSIAALWYPERLVGTRDFEQDRALAETAPGVSMHGLALRGGVAMRPVPPLAIWPAARDEAQALRPDVIISVLYLDRIPPLLLDAFPHRVVNLHPTMLPAYRGRWPTFNMLWDRSIDRFGGMSLHLVTPVFDAGAMVAQQPAVFPADRNLSAYYVHLIQAGAGLLTQKLPLYLSGRLSAVNQPATAAPQGNRDPREAKLTSDLDWRRVEWLCATIPQMTRLRVQGDESAGSVRRFIDRVGPPAGAPPARQGDVLLMDARDARVSLAVG